jgi:hypothetical protein
MIEVALPFFFGLMLAMVIVWFVLIRRLFNLLRNDHPMAYEKLGSPTLFYNNSIKNNSLFLRFLLRKEFESLNDPTLSNLCRIMRLYLAVYLVLFLIFAGLILAVIFEHPIQH